MYVFMLHVFCGGGAGGGPGFKVGAEGSMERVGLGFRV